MKVNKKYKDTVFRRLFNTEEKLLELYNAIFGTNYKDWSAIKINTLEDVLFMSLKNDLSFKVYNILVLIEHQSTISENMPARMFMYLGRLYEKETNNSPNAIYGRNPVELPNPEFIVLYNGKEDFPEEGILNISTVLKKKDGRKNLIDLEVRVININKGVNPELESKSKTLADYISLIAKAREYEESQPLEEAIKLAVNYCIDNDILKEFLLENASEVINMLTAEFNMDTALEVAHKEGIEKGIERGLEKGKQEGQNYVLKLMSQGLNYEEIKKKIEEI
jgi:hypothetical protein